jgi:hypothetical protein
MKRSAVALMLALALPHAGAAKPDYRGYVGFDLRQFDGKGAQGQSASFLSLSAAPEVSWSWNEGDDQAIVAAFARLDSEDEERTHADLRQAYWMHLTDDAEWRVGLDVVFWGVTESQHLVDIINQTDAVEGADGEDKLGQPMVAWMTEQDWGRLSLYWLPYFRERTFPGRDGRLRGFLPVTGDSAYESAAEQWHQDFAARWAQSYEDLEVALSVFRGTDRTPDFFIDASLINGIQLRAFYPQLLQLGVEGQYIQGDTMWKVEAVWRDRGPDQYTAAVVGLEHTLYGIFGTVYDLGLLLEYHYDERGIKNINPFDNDTFVGARLALNDESSTEVLGGFIVDNDHQGWSFFAETSTRLSSHWKISANAWLFSGFPAEDILSQIQQDDFVEVELQYYF